MSIMMALEESRNHSISRLCPLMRGKRVYLDKKRLSGGDIIDPSLATALCQSVCMIMVYTRNYFHKEHTYCAREYKAMELLEERRLARLGKQWDNSHGLIIPIIIRGKKYFPKFIEVKRQYYDFSDYIRPKCIEDNILTTNEKYASDIIKIAECVCDRYLELKDICRSSDECRDFSIPAEEEVIHWLEGHNGANIPFPYHNGGTH